MSQEPKSEMLMTTVRARAYTSKAGYSQLDGRLAQHRTLYNAGLEHRRTAYRTAGDSVSFAAQNRELTKVRADDADGFGAEDRRLAVGTLARLDKAYTAFFKRGGFPRFKNAARFRTLEIYSGANRYLRAYNPETGKGVIRIKGLPPIRFKDKRIPTDADGKPIQPKRILITRTANLLHVSMAFENGEKPPVSDVQPKNPIGMDAGVNKRGAFSDGRTLPRRRRSRKPKRHARKMAGQRRAAVKQGRARWTPIGGGRVRLEWTDGKPSGGYQKTRATYAKTLLRERTANRQDLHRTARAILDRHDFIAVEDLQIPNMTRSAAGTVDDPGTGVSQKRGLNRAIGEQTWGELTAILERKAESAGVPFVRVDPKYTSQTCSACGAVDARSRNGERFDCRACGFSADADTQAAVNILRRGLSAAGFDSDIKAPDLHSRPRIAGSAGALTSTRNPRAQLALF